MTARREFLAAALAAPLAAARKPYSLDHAAVVDGVALAHTAQFASGSVDDALSQVDKALKGGGSSLDRAVKLHFAMASDDIAAEAAEALKRRYAKRELKPAVTLVTGALPRAGQTVAIDAVGVTSKARMRDAAVGVLPAGGRTYVSGQSANGTIPEATRATMEKLHQALKHQGLDWKHVVQVKTFLDPIQDAASVRGMIDGYFSGPVPQVFVEWTSRGKIEIELIAEAPTAKEAIEYLTPPGETASPVFARIARVAHPTTIFVSGLHGATPGDGARQIHDIFATLKNTVGAAGGDLAHLAKATYYVGDDTVSRQLNEIRPSYYDPKRPPAASKAPVRGVGRKGMTITLDMIAVPAR